MFNLAVGYLLFRAGKVSSGDHAALLIFFAGISAISNLLSVRFAEKHTS